MGPCLAGSFVYRNCTEGPADKDCLLRGCYLGDETMVVTIVRFVMKTQMCVRSGLQEGVPGGGQIQTRPHIPQRLVKRWGCVTIGPQMSLLGGRIGRPGPLSPGETSGRDGQILSFRRQTFHSGIEQRHLAPGPRMLPRLFLWAALRLCPQPEALCGWRGDGGGQVSQPLGAVPRAHAS